MLITGFFAQMGDGESDHPIDGEWIRRNLEAITATIVISAVQDNSTFQEQLNKAVNAETVFEIAKKPGLNVPANVSHSLQLRGDDLETVSGGAMTPVLTLGYWSKKRISIDLEVTLSISCQMIRDPFSPLTIRLLLH